jgi:hypothetical protein
VNVGEGRRESGKNDGELGVQAIVVEFHVGRGSE